MKHNCDSFSAKMRIFIFIYILCLKIRLCFQDTVIGGNFQKNKKMNSRIILTRDNIGPKMCIRECLRKKNCNGINFQKDFLKCELLSNSNLESQLVSTPGFSYSDISDWKMKADSCWPNNPCSEKTRCIPSKSNDHVCLKHRLSDETFLEKIPSPGFPDKYEYNLNVTWTIKAGIGNNVALRFTHFDLESCCDYVKVYECGDNSDRLLGSFTGEELPPEVRSIGNCIAIIMTTDGSVNKAGFSANIYEMTS